MRIYYIHNNMWIISTIFFFFIFLSHNYDNNNDNNIYCNHMCVWYARAYDTSVRCAADDACSYMSRSVLYSFLTPLAVWRCRRFNNRNPARNRPRVHTVHKPQVGRRTRVWRRRELCTTHCVYNVILSGTFQISSYHRNRTVL